MSLAQADRRRVARSQSLDRGFGLGDVGVGPAIEQCLHQNTRDANAVLARRVI
jgi:hypothetical protein